MAVLVAYHGMPPAAGSNAARVNYYSEIESLRRELELRAIDRTEVLPCTERFSEMRARVMKGVRALADLSLKQAEH